MKHVMFHVLENYTPEMVGDESSHTMNWRTLTLPAYNVRADFKPRTDLNAVCENANGIQNNL